MDKNINSVENLKIEEYELNYLKIRPIIASIIGVEELSKIEMIKQIRLFFIQSYQRDKLTQITDIIKYSKIYINASNEEKYIAVYYELRKYIPDYFIPEYYCLPKVNGGNSIKVRDKIYNHMQLHNIIILEKFNRFQHLCLQINHNKYDRLDNLAILVEKLGDDAKLLFIPEIFNVKDPLLTKELIDSVPDVINEETIKKIKLIAYYRDRKKISKEVINFVFNKLLYDINQSKELIDNFHEKIDEIKDYKINPFNKSVSFESLYMFFSKVENGDRIGKLLQIATNEEPKYLEMINNDKTGWFAKYINNTTNFLNKVIKENTSTK
jgi:hypothetical protein